MQRVVRFTLTTFSSHKRVIGLLLLFTVLGISLSFFRDKTIVASKAQVASSSFIFTAAGDYNNNSNASATLDQIPASGANFNLALGDLSYGGIRPETAWCDYVKARVGATFPFELISGNHDVDGESPGQHISNFVTCLPNRITGMVGDYGKEYYFNYPETNPNTRVILISPDNTIDGVYYDYAKNTPRYNWVANAIDDARANGIKWIIVGNHYPCHVLVSGEPCYMGVDLFNLLIEKKIDIILAGHAHTYTRSKQFAISQDCPQVPVNTYNPACIVDDGADNSYTKGAGTMVVTVGTGGVSLYDINTNDPEIGYFAKWSGNNANPTYGLSKFTVTDSQIASQFLRSAGGTFTDSFSIVDTGAPQPTNPVPSPTPTSSTQTLIPQGTTWKYLDNNTRPSGWNGLVYDDSLWKSGISQLGYGDGDEQTVVSYGSNANAKYITTYFRKNFTIANPSAVSNLTLQLKRDDGAVVYLNGNEVFRNSMPTGTITHTTLAADAGDENAWRPTTINPGLLQSGTNVIAVEVHQSAADSSDMSFDFSLTGTIASEIPSSTPTSNPNIPTVTPTNTPAPTNTPIPTNTPVPTNTPAPTNTPIPTPTPAPDVTAPNVTITSPANNATVTRNSTTTIRATASDNIRVTKVEFYVNNTLKCTDTTSSYTCNWAVPSGRNITYTLTARAYDGAGNIKTHSIVVRSR